MGGKSTSEKKKNYELTKFQRRLLFNSPLHHASELPEQANKETHNFDVPNPSCAMLEVITTAQAGRPKQ